MFYYYMNVLFVISYRLYIKYMFFSLHMSNKYIMVFKLENIKLYLYLMNEFYSPDIIL